ncbi:MAG: hypothetical protein OHK0029_01700 [Armatimonadaceae bacterium]
MSAAAPTFTASGFEGGAFEFDGGTNNFITAPVNINPTVMPQVTFGVWANADVVDSIIRGIISHDNVDFDRTINVDIRDGSGLRWSAFRGNGVVGGPNVVAGEWVFLALRHNQTTGDWAFDVNDTRLILSGVTFGTGESVLTIGRNPNFDSPFDGRIDNVFVFNEYLTDSQIDTIRTGGSEAILSFASSNAPEPATFGLLLMGAVPFVVKRIRNR